ncbi:MAG: transcription elongation factor GreA [Actinomycetota bacterium]
MAKEIILTHRGKEILEEELKDLIEVRRKEVAKRLRDAKDYGDISDNSEYEDAKNEQAFIEGRVAEIQHILANAKIIDEKKARKDKVRLGLTATLRDLKTSKLHEFRIVGSYEADPDLMQISHESPVGQAILGKKVGDIVEIELPHGKLKYKVEDIKK